MVYDFAEIKIAQVSSAIPLTPDQELDLISRLRNRTGAKEIKLVTNVDKSLLSGLKVQKDSDEISKYTKLVYNISSTNKERNNFFFPSNKIIEFDSIMLMSKFYPWIVRYAQKKGLDPDKPRYLTKVTETF